VVSGGLLPWKKNAMYNVEDGIAEVFCLSSGMIPFVYNIDSLGPEGVMLM
jgi:hypothetical protein